jgi:transcriptional regulator with XRE-family HTH domain
MAGTFTRALRRHRAVLSEVLTEARQEAGLTQRELAARLNVAYTTVARVEQGQRRVDVLELMLWAKAIEVPAGTLFKRVERRVGTLG